MSSNSDQANHDGAAKPSGQDVDGFVNPFRALALRTKEEIVRQNGLPIDLIESVLRWPWQPFISLTEHESEEMDRLKRVGWIPESDLREWLSSTENAREVYQHISDRYRLLGHERSIVGVGDIRSIVAVFGKVLPKWSLLDPEWLVVEEYLISKCGVGPIEIKNLNLLDIRRYFLESLKSRKPNSQQKKKRSAVTRQTLTEREEEVWLLRKRGLSFTEIGNRVGITRQAATQAFERAEKITNALATRSIKAKQVEKYDELGGSRSSEL